MPSSTEECRWVSNCPAGASILVRWSNVDEVLLTTSAFAFAAGSLGFRYEGGDTPCSQKDFQPFVVASVGYYRQRLSADLFTRLVRHFLKSGPLKNLSVRVNNANNRRNFNSDFDQTRIIFNYQLSTINCHSDPPGRGACRSCSSPPPCVTMANPLAGSRLHE